MSDELREAIEASVKEHGGESSDDNTSNEAQVSGSGSEDGEGTSEVREDAETGKQGESSSGKDGRSSESVRNETSGEGNEQLKESGSEEQTGDNEKGRKASLNPPNTWKPGPREKWNELPEEIQAEVLRREHDFQRGLNEVAGVKNFQRNFEQVIQPFMPYIQATAHGNPLQSVHNVMTTAAQLHSGDSRQKAETVGDIIDQFGIDIAVLDEVLTARLQGGGRRSASDHSNLQQLIQQELAPIKQAFQGFQEQGKTGVQEEINEFAGKAEFFDDVREDMADILELAAKRGQNMTLQEAYDRATMMRTDIADIIAQRKAKEQARSDTRVADEALGKAVSLESSTSATSSLPPPPEDASLEDAIRYAVSKHM